MANITEILKTDLRHQKDFVKTDSGGDLQTISGLDNIKEAILRRIMTEPGTLAHRPNYGIGLKQFQNSPMTIATQQAIAKRLQEQLVTDSRISELLSVSIDSEDRTPDKVIIKISVKLEGYDEPQMLEIPFGEVF